MTRPITLAAAQLGANQETASRQEIADRLLALLDRAVGEGVQMLVYPELALTTYFPKKVRDRSEYDGFYDSKLPTAETEQLFQRARDAGVAFHLGYAERSSEGTYYNSSVYVDADGEIVGRYRKIHLPGRTAQTTTSDRPVVYEPLYFAHGDLGLRSFQTKLADVGLFLCQDRRYPEVYRTLGLAGAEIALTGYNTPVYPLALDHNELALRAGAYENSMFVVAAAKAGVEDGVPFIGGSCVIDPNGQVLARAHGSGDELVTARIDLDWVEEARASWNFYGRRHPHEYTSLTAPVQAPETKSVL